MFGASLAIGGEMLPFEAQLAVGVIFHHQQLVAHQSLGQCLAVGTAIGDTARVLEVGHAVEQFGIGAACQQRIQRRQIQTLFFKGDRLEGGLVDRKGLNSAKVTRLFDDEILPLIDQHLAQQIQRLLGAAGDQDVVRIDLHAVAGQIAVGNILAQRGEAFGRRILQGGSPLFAQHILTGLIDRLDRKQVGIGQATGEGDDLRIGGNFEDFTDKGRLDLLEALGKKRLHRQFSRHVGGRSIRPPGYPFVSDFRNEAMIVTKIAKKGLERLYCGLYWTVSRCGDASEGAGKWMAGIFVARNTCALGLSWDNSLPCFRGSMKCRAASGPARDRTQDVLPGLMK